MSEETELKAQIPMADYLRMQTICNNVKKAVEYPIKQMEERLKAMHERLADSYQKQSEDIWERERESLEKAHGNTHEWPTEDVPQDYTW